MITKRSLAERLDDLLHRVGGGTYKFDAGADGREVLRIMTGPDGDTYAAAGASKADAIAAMERRLTKD